MTRIHCFHAVVVAALIASISIHAQGRQDATAPATFSGTYSPDCSNAAAPRVRVSTDALTVEDGTRKIQASAPRSAPTYFAAVPPPGFQTALIANVSPGEQIVFVVYRTPAGYAIKLNGSANVQESLGKILLPQTLHRCSTPPQGGGITTIAGSGSSCGRPVEGGPAVAAQLCFPNGIAVDKAGNVYIVNTRDNRVYQVDPAGVLHTFAGYGPNQMFAGDGGPANRAVLTFPYDVTLD
jgi:hypothetical protein